MKKIVSGIIGLLLMTTAGCCQAQSQPSQLIIRLSCEQMGDRFTATWDKNEERGGMKAPSIPFRLVFKNNTISAISFEKLRLTIQADAQNSKHHESVVFPIDKIIQGATLQPGAEYETTIEAGEFLTSVAGRFMKGDTLTVKALLDSILPLDPKIHAESEGVRIYIFVPEG